jgi:hypothetical protein
MGKDLNNERGTICILPARRIKRRDYRFVLYCAFVSFTRKPRLSLKKLRRAGDLARSSFCGASIKGCHSL